MKKTTPPSLSHRITKYGTLSLAIAGLADANGQIIYTDIDPDSAGTTTLNNTPINIDMDNDGMPEFDIRLQSTVSLDINPLLPGAAVLGNDYGGSASNYDYPFALYNGDIISSIQNTWISSTDQILVFNNCSYTGSDYNQWCDVTDRYLGLRFLIGSETHYGWARLTVGELPDNWILKDYAYNSVPESAGPGHTIMAGETTLGVDDNILNKVKIIALNRSIALYNLPQKTGYNVFNMSGQNVLHGNISTNTHVIEANTLSTGIYIIELRDKASNAVVRKKIAL